MINSLVIEYSHVRQIVLVIEALRNEFKQNFQPLHKVNFSRPYFWFSLQSDSWLKVRFAATKSKKTPNSVLNSFC